MNEILHAFISSPVRGLEDDRRQIRALTRDDGLKVYVDEIDHPRASGEGFLTLEDLFGRIRAARLVVVLLATPRHGSGIPVGTEKAHVSYWEAELFFCILQNKPIQVFVTDDFRPGPELAALLTLFQRALPQSSWRGPVSRHQLVEHVRQHLVATLGAADPVPTGGRRSVHVVVDGLFRLRGADAQGGTADHEALQFFSTWEPDTTVRPNETLVNRLFSELSSLSSEEGRLTRLWLIFRQLSGQPLGLSCPETLPLWNRFFGEWTSAGSWYGLHSHHYFAVLPGLVQQAKLRAEICRLGSAEWKNEPTFYPGGSLASARYSVANLCGSRINRRRLLHCALRDIQRSLAEGVQNPADLFAVRGSVYRRLGAYGAAVEDYEAVVERRREAGASSADIGQALSELGYGYLFQLRLGRARSFMEEGVRLLTGTNARTGFLIRAKRKLAIGYYLTGRFARARKETDEARALAITHQVHDQLSSL